jgi:hypothetical protein
MSGPSGEVFNLPAKAGWVKDLECEPPFAHCALGRETEDPELRTGVLARIHSEALWKTLILIVLAIRGSPECCGAGINTLYGL